MQNFSTIRLIVQGASQKNLRGVHPPYIPTWARVNWVSLSVIAILLCTFIVHGVKWGWGTPDNPSGQNSDWGTQNLKNLGGVHDSWVLKVWMSSESYVLCVYMSSTEGGTLPLARTNSHFSIEHSMLQRSCHHQSTPRQYTLVRLSSSLICEVWEECQSGK